VRAKLLIVDDDDNIRRVLGLSFRALGYEILQARDGEEAEQVALSQQPDLIILDVMMPKKNGFATCRDLKCNPGFHQVPIVLLTAKDEREDIYWGYDSGADAYVTKPYVPRRLEALVAELLQEAAEGHRRVAWTGLPSEAAVLSEHRTRLEAGGAPVLFRLEWPDRPREVFSQKYGPGALRDLVFRVSWALRESQQDVLPTAVMGQDGEDNFTLLMGPEDGEASLHPLLTATEPLIHSYYTPEEREARAVVCRDGVTHSSENVDLLHLTFKRVE